jgi:hypothetical protein
MLSTPLIAKVPSARICFRISPAPFSISPGVGTPPNKTHTWLSNVSHLDNTDALVDMSYRWNKHTATGAAIHRIYMCIRRIKYPQHSLGDAQCPRILKHS